MVARLNRKKYLIFNDDVYGGRYSVIIIITFGLYHGIVPIRMMRNCWINIGGGIDIIKKKF